MPTFVNTPHPTAWGFFDSEAAFQTAADGMVLFVKRSLGDDILSVELTNKMIWTCFEEATLEYGFYINMLNIKSQMGSLLGSATGSVDLTNKNPKHTLEFFLQQAEAYATPAGLAGSMDSTLGYFNLETGRQDYNLHTELRTGVSSSMFPSGTLVMDTVPSGSRGRFKVLEVMHYEPLAAQNFLLNASNLTNFMATEFAYEGYVNSTVFYVLPVFEDVLRRGMLEEAFRVRRSHFSYQLIGSVMRIYPIPGSTRTPFGNPGKLWVRVYAGQQNPLSSSYIDDTINGVSSPSNVPYTTPIPWSTINEPGKQWIRQYTLALCKVLLGHVRSKFKTIPIPGAEVTLDGDSLVQEGRDDIAKLKEELSAMLAELSLDKIAEREASLAEQLNKQLRFIPPPRGAIRIGLEFQK